MGFGELGSPGTNGAVQTNYLKDTDSLLRALTILFFSWGVKIHHFIRSFHYKATCKMFFVVSATLVMAVLDSESKQSEKVCIRWRWIWRGFSHKIISERTVVCVLLESFVFALLLYYLFFLIVKISTSNIFMFIYIALILHAKNC